ncbi:unnamed protein product [Durusdinium trenchii]|uniref:Uncharacterized protein n=1 Tax=Durusdinium trenchii TaxID=1381693 RepID=A0ABP0SHC5_9DINO
MHAQGHQQLAPGDQTHSCALIPLCHDISPKNQSNCFTSQAASWEVSLGLVADPCGKAKGIGWHWCALLGCVFPGFATKPVEEHSTSNLQMVLKSARNIPAASRNGTHLMQELT